MSTVITEVKTEVKSKRTKKPKVEKEKKGKEKVEKVEKVEKPKVEKPKTVKTKVDKYNGFKVPDRKVVSTRWLIHIYNMIKEAQQELLQKDDVRNAYNNLGECLRKYDGYIESYIPSKYQKYNSGIDIMKNGVVIFNYNTFRLIYENGPDHANPQRKTLQEKKAEFITEFTLIYTPLFDLIKRDVINYMELKKYEIENKYIIGRKYYQIGKIERTIKAYEIRIAQFYKELGKLSEDVIKCKQQPPLTVFE